MGHPWMSMFVGAYKPRQKTAFAFEEFNVIVAAKDARAAHSSNNTRIVFSPASEIPAGAHLDWSENATQGPATGVVSLLPLIGDSDRP
jgi:hypothetical protein